MSSVVFFKISKKVVAGSLSCLLLCSSALTPLAHANPLATFSKGPVGQELGNQEKDGFFNPVRLRERLAGQQSVVQEMKRREERQEYLKRKSLSGVLKNIGELIQSKFNSQEEFESEMERRRRASAAIFGEGGLFSFVKYADGKKVWFKGGQVGKVENEQVKDARGNVSRRNMDEMEYDKKGLLISYKSSVEDAQGNTKNIYWHGATYTDDSKAYGGEGTPYQKLITGYTEEVTDENGHTTTVDWRGGTYNDKNQLTGYEQTSTDLDGNKSFKSWSNATYNETGQLTGFNETNTDSLGLKSERHWSGGTYEKNPSYIDRDKTPNLSEYNLVKYHEDVTDAHGQTISHDWTDATYNEFGELVSYQDTTKKTVDGQELTQILNWTEGKYDSFGHVTSYNEVKTGFDGETTLKEWRDGEYDTKGRLVSYNENDVDANNNLSKKSWRVGADGGYDDKDHLTSYQETIVDARGNSSEHEWNAQNYDSHGRLMGYVEKNIDPHGNTKSRTWSTDETGYDAYGQVLHYKESTLDDQGNTTSKDWQNGTYDNRGHLLSYDEIDVDVHGAEFKKTWEGGTYDSLDRVTGYMETRTDPDGNIEKTLWNGGVYNSKGNLLGYHEEVTNVFGETQKKDWQATDADYDKFGNLLGYRETITGFDGLITDRVRKNSEYNRLGQLTSYEESVIASGAKQSLLQENSSPSAEIASPFGFAMTRVWKGGTYNSRGELIAYQEDVDDNNGLTQSKVWEGTYNAKGDLNFSKDTLTDIHGVTIDTEWVGTQFDSRGRATASKQTQIYDNEPGVALITTSSGKTFDRHGQVSGGTETTLTAGTGVDGRSVYLSRSSKIRGSTFSDGALTGYSQTTHTSGTDSNLTWISFDEEKVVSNLTRTGYVEKNTTDGHTVTVTRSLMKRDSLGHLISYTDQIEDPATGAIPTIDHRLSTQYDSFGNLVSFSDSITDQKNQTKLKTTTGVTQDSHGNLLRYQEKTEYDDVGTNVSEHVVEQKDRLSSSYDTLGRLVSSVDQVSSSKDPETRLIAWNAKEFDLHNRVATDSSVTVTNGKETFTSNRNLITYNKFGQISGYRELSTDSKKPNEVVNHQVSDMTYDAFGTLSTSRDVSLTREFKDDFSSTVKGNLTTETIRADAEFDSSGRLVAFEETTHQQGRDEDGNVLDHYQKRKRTSSVYDEQHPSRVSDYTEQLTDSASPGLLTTIHHVNQSFGLSDRPTEYTESVIARSGATWQSLKQENGSPSAEIASPFGFAMTQNIHRTGITYNDKGGVLSYFETRSSSDKPSESEQVNFNATYDDKNRMTGFQEVVTTLLNGQTSAVVNHSRNGITYDSQDNMRGYLDTSAKQVMLDDGSLSTADVTTLDRSNMTYNQLQQLSDYDETKTQTSTGQEERVVFRAGQYDRGGRLFKYHQNSLVKNTNPDDPPYYLETTTDRLQTSFDAMGRVNGYLEQKSSSDKPNLLVVETGSDMRYDDQGRLSYSFKDEHTQSLDLSRRDVDFHKTTVLDGVAYNQQGQMLDKTETVRTFNAGLDFSEVNKSHGLTYNAWGLASSYDVDKWSSQAPDENKILHHEATATDQWGRERGFYEKTDSNGFIRESWKNNIQLNGLGQLLSFEQKDHASDSDKTFTTDWAGTYDSSGRLTSFSETKSDDQSAVVITSVRKNITYDNAGFTNSYDETSVSSAAPDVTNLNSWHAKGYNTAGLLSGFSETKTVKGLDFETVDQHERDQIGYLKNGLLSSYQDRNNSSLSPNVTALQIRKSTGYDSMGRENTFSELMHTMTPDGSLDTVSTRDRQSSLYNDKNQLVGTQERRWSDTAPNVVSHVGWTGTYNPNGLLDSSRELDHQIGLYMSAQVYDRTLVNSLFSRKYDSFERVIQEKTQADNGQGEVSDRDWTASGYNSQGQLLGDVELTSTGQTTRTGLSYDDQGRLHLYNDSVTGSAASNLVTAHIGVEIGYNQNGQRVSDSGEIESKDMATNGQNFYSSQSHSKTTTYDNKGRLLGFNDTTMDHSLGVTTTVDQSNTSYNEMGFESGSDQTIHKKSLVEGVLDTTQVQTQKVTAFNRLGQALNSLGTSWSSDAPDIINVTKTNNMRYNAKGQLNSFRQISESNDQSGLGRLASYSDTSRNSTDYDKEGRVIHTNTNQISSNASSVSDTQDENFTYNDLGQKISDQTSSYRHTADLRLDLHSNQTTHLTYDRWGQVSSDEKTSTSSQAPALVTTETNNYQRGEAGLIVGTQTQLNVQGQTGPLQDSEIDSILSTTAFNNLTQVQKDSLKVLMQQGQAINQTQTSNRSDIVNDSQGRVLTFQETKNSSDAPAVTTSSARQRTEYNSLGQVTLTSDKTSRQGSVDGKIIDLENQENKLNIQYDATGREISFDGESVDLKTNVIHNSGRLQTTYNDLGQVVSKIDKTRVRGTDSSTGLAMDVRGTDTQKAMTYDAQGRLIHFQQTSESEATGTKNSSWSADSFDAFGHAHHTRESGNGGTEGTWTRDATVFLFDSEGRSLLTRNVGTSSTQGSSDYFASNVNDDSSAAFNALGQSTRKLDFGFRYGTGQFSEETKSGLQDSYDSLGRANHLYTTLHQFVIPAANTVIPAKAGIQVSNILKTTITEPTAQTYDIFGQLIDKKSTVTETIPGELTNIGKQHWTGGYDSKGRALYFTNDNETDILDPKEGPTLHSHDHSGRKNIQYLPNGQPADYEDFQDSVTKDQYGKTQAENHSTDHKTNLQYNAAGNLTHMEESGLRDKVPYTGLYDASDFDSNGNAIKWTRVENNPSTGPTTTNQDSGKFDDQGRLVSFKQTGIAGGQAFSKSVSNTTYNARGQAVHLDEKGETDAGGYHNSQEMGYDLLGRMVSKIEKGEDAQGSYTSSLLDPQYDVSGKLLTKSTERINSIGEKTVIAWNAGEFDSMGRLLNSTEIEKSYDAAGKLKPDLVTRNWKGSYFENGILETSVTTSTTDKSDGTQEVSVVGKSNKAYDENALVTSTENSSTQTVYKTDGSIDHKNESFQLQDNITRYTAEDESKNSSHHAGRISGYDETATKDTDKPTYNLVQDLSYDENGIEKNSNRVNLTTSFLGTLRDEIVSVSKYLFAAIKEKIAELLGGLKKGFTDLIHKSQVPDLGDVTVNLPSAQKILSPSDYTVDFVHRTNLKQDGMGRSTKWIEESRSSVAYLKVVTSEVKVSYKGSTSELETYEATTKEKIGLSEKTTTMNLHDYEYTHGLVSKVQGRVEENEVDTRSGEVTFQQSYDYEEFTAKFDGQGRALEMERKTISSSSAPDLVRDEKTTLTYDAQGRVESRDVRTDESGKNSAGEKLEKRSHFKDTYTYNNKNQIIKTVRDSDSDSSAPEIKSKEIIESDEFDGYGRATLTSTTRTTTSSDNVTIEKNTDKVLAFGANGQATLIERLSSSKEDNDSITTSNQSQIIKQAFDISGRQIRTEGDVNDHSVTKGTSDATDYDENGNGTVSNRELTQDRSYHYVNQNLEFNSLGQVSHSRQVTTNDSASNFTYTYADSHMTYDKSGHVANTITQNATREKSGLTHSYTDEKNATAWDKDGNPTAFTTTTTNDSNNLGLTTVSTYTDGVYEHGRLVQADLTTTAYATNPDGTEAIEFHGLATQYYVYDKLGRSYGVGEWDQDKYDNLKKDIGELKNNPNPLDVDIENLDKEIKSEKELLAGELKILDETEAEKVAPYDKAMGNLEAFKKKLEEKNQPLFIMLGWFRIDIVGLLKTYKDAKKEINDEFDKKRGEARAAHILITTDQNKIDIDKAKNIAGQADLTNKIDALTLMEQTNRTSLTTGIAYDENGKEVGRTDWEGTSKNNVVTCGNTYNKNTGQLESYQRHYVGRPTETVKLAYLPNGQLDSTTVSSIEKINGEEHEIKTISKILAKDILGRTQDEERQVNDSFTADKTDVFVVSSTYGKNGHVLTNTSDHSQIVGGVKTYIGKDTNENTSFDSLGRVINFTRTSTLESERSVVTTSTGKNIYGEEGKLVGTDEIIDKKGDVINTSQHVVNIITKFDNGRPVNQIRLVDQDLSHPGVSTLDTISTKYGQGLNSTTTTQRREVAPGMDARTYTIEDQNTFNSKGQLTDQISKTSNDSFIDDKSVIKTTTRSGLTYDAVGHLTGEDILTQDSSQPDGDKTLHHTGMEYNADGQLTKFHEVDKDVVRDVSETQYDEHGWITTQTETRSWNGTNNGNIQGLNGDWTQGSVGLTQSYQYDQFGRITGYSLTARGGGFNAELQGLAVAGTGGAMGFGSMNTTNAMTASFTKRGGAPIELKLDRSNIQYDVRGRVVHYNQISSQWEKTKENYLKSSRGWKGNRKVGTREVAGLVSRNESVDTLEFNSFGQAVKTYSTFSTSTGDYGWSKQSNITYDTQGRMATATTESFYVTHGRTNGTSYTAELHSKKDQAFTYDANGKVTTKDTQTYFDDQKITQSKSGNFFSSDIGKFTKIAVVVVVAVVVSAICSPIVGAWASSLVSTAMDMLILDQTGASPKQKWQLLAFAIGVELITLGIPGPKQTASVPFKEGANQAAKAEMRKKILEEIALKTTLGYGILKAGEKIAVGHGQETSAAWLVVMNYFTSDFKSAPKSGKPGKNPLNLKPMSPANITVAASMVGTKLGLMAIAKNNQKPGQDSSWLMGALTYSSDMLTNIIGGSLGSAIGYKLEFAKPDSAPFNEKQKGLYRPEYPGTLAGKVQAGLTQFFGWLLGVKPATYQVGETKVIGGNGSLRSELDREKIQTGLYRNGQGEEIFRTKEGREINISLLEEAYGFVSKDTSEAFNGYLENIESDFNDVEDKFIKEFEAPEFSAKLISHLQKIEGGIEDNLTNRFNGSKAFIQVGQKELNAGNYEKAEVLIAKAYSSLSDLESVATQINGAIPSLVEGFIDLSKAYHYSTPGRGTEPVMKLSEEDFNLVFQQPYFKADKDFSAAGENVVFGVRNVIDGLRTLTDEGILDKAELRALGYWQQKFYLDSVQGLANLQRNAGVNLEALEKMSAVSEIPFEITAGATIGNLLPRESVNAPVILGQIFGYILMPWVALPRDFISGFSVGGKSYKEGLLKGDFSKNINVWTIRGMIQGGFIANFPTAIRDGAASLRTMIQTHFKQGKLGFSLNLAAVIPVIASSKSLRFLTTLESAEKAAVLTKDIKELQVASQILRESIKDFRKAGKLEKAIQNETELIRVNGVLKYFRQIAKEEGLSVKALSTEINKTDRIIAQSAKLTLNANIGQVVKADSKLAKNVPELRDLFEVNVGATRARRILVGENGKIAVIGRHMGKDGRAGVIQYSDELKKLGYDVEIYSKSTISAGAKKQFKRFKSEYGTIPNDQVVKTKMYRENISWAKKLKTEGYTVIDVGNPYRRELSPFFEGEKEIIFGWRK